MSQVSDKEREYIKSLGRHAQMLEKQLQQEKERLFSLKKPGLKECQQCGFCCLNVSCVPRPDEIGAIADFLNISVTELVQKYMVIDKFTDTNYFLRFAKEGQEDITGRLFNKEHWFDYGYCIFFNKATRSCRIYPVRPLEARYLNCWEDELSRLDSKGSSFWKKDAIFKFVPDFKP